MTRLASGIVLAILILVLVIYGTSDMFFFFVLATVTVCLIEFYSMLESGSEPCFKEMGVVLGAAFCAVIYMGDHSFTTAFTAMAVLFTFIVAILGYNAIDDPVRKVANTVFGLFYVAVTLSTLALIRKEPDGHLYVMALIASNALCDTFAYYTGRAFGKTPLAPAISPGKTREGFWGGVVGAMVGAFIVLFFFPHHLGYDSIIGIGLISGFIGPIGDLSESAIKRRMKVKDSGFVIPGHGGALGRVDSLMFSSSFFYMYKHMVIIL